MAFVMSNTHAVLLQVVLITHTHTILSKALQAVIIIQGLSTRKSAEHLGYVKAA